jgi:hypothetical protein
LKKAFKVLAFVVGIPVILMFGFGLWYAWTTGAFVRAADVHVADATAAVRDARQLIDSFRSSGRPDQTAQHLRPEELPNSVRIPKLRYANVFRDHVNLVLGRNPDWSVGARIWSSDSTTVHADQTTAYSDIYFFQYCNDIPVSPQNLP